MSDQNISCIDKSGEPVLLITPILPITPICSHWHAIDGYETYLVDANTIGVRPIWCDVKYRLPELMENLPHSRDVLAYWISHGRSNEMGFPNTYAEGESYLSIDRLVLWSDTQEITFRCDRFYGKVTHWMELPKPPD